MQATLKVEKLLPNRSHIHSINNTESQDKNYNNRYYRNSRYNNYNNEKTNRYNNIRCYH